MQLPNPESGAAGLASWFVQTLKAPSVNQSPVNDVNFIKRALAYVKPGQERAIQEIAKEVDSIMWSVNAQAIANRGNETAVANIAAVAPNFFFWNLDSFRPLFASFGRPQALISIANPHTADRLLQQLSNRVVDIEQLSPQLRLALALHSNKSGHASREPSASKARRISSLYNPGDNSKEGQLVNAALASRILSMSTSRVAEENFGGRTAILILGQIRNGENWEEILRALPSFVTGVDKEIFVSTWKQPGAIQFQPSRFDRIFSPDALHEVRMLSQDELAELQERYRPDFFDSGAANVIRDLLGGSGIPININAPDESGEAFRSLDRQEKMFYHNRYWVNALDPMRLSDRFDYVVKVRPDLDTRNSDPITHDELKGLGSKVATETGSRLTFEGYLSGDQLIYGRADKVESLLSIDPRTTLSGRLSADVFKRPHTNGHELLALQSYLAGIELLPARKRVSLGTQQKIGLTKLKELQSQ